MNLTPAQSLVFKNHLERFTKLEDSEFAQITRHFTFKKIKKNQLLIKEGDQVMHTYWVMKGLLASCYTNPDGKEYILQFAIENCWITDQNAFYNKTAAIFNIVCYEDAELLCLSF